jgi:hypothetical protein
LSNERESVSMVIFYDFVGDHFGGFFFETVKIKYKKTPKDNKELFEKFKEIWVNQNIYFLHSYQ